MISHILVPLDGSPLAECVFPHVLAIAQAVDARITLLHVLERPRETGELPTDPLHWHLKKNAIKVYLDQITARLQDTNLKVTNTILDGVPAERIIEHANANNVDLIALSTHGHSGLSGWNVSSVVQKIILRAYKSTLLVRAYKTPTSEIDTVYAYKRLFVGLDCSARAEMVLPVAISLSQFYQAKLTLAVVVRNPELLHRFPPSDEDQGLVKRISYRNQQAAEHYFKQLSSQLSLQGINVKTRLIASDHVIATLYDMVDQEKADLVMLVAHGHSAQDRWPYGTVAASFISFGNTDLMIMQDFSSNEIRQTQAEMAARETKGH